MEPYSELASRYDHILEHVNYQEWYDYIKAVMHRFVEKPEILLELGCGTGKFGAKFSTDNYTIYGMDNSINMLRVAKIRAFKNFHIFCADMKNFHLAQKPDFIFCVHDAMNYFLEYADIKKVLASVRNIMNENSVFMFDITTEYNINENFHHCRSDFSVRGTDIEWTNYYERKKKLVYSTLRFRKKNKPVSIEEHVQRIYSVKEIKGLLNEENFEILGIYGDHSFHPPRKDTVMINFVVKKTAAG
ncbi:MAG: class I SAM-dependent methyltransferase [bacterium]|nr:class I SAM-dependent methyltransferase [bacterium]